MEESNLFCNENNIGKEKVAKKYPGRVKIKIRVDTEIPGQIDI